MQGFAQRHERAFLTGFFVFVLAGLVGAAVEATGDGHALEVALAWVGAFAVTAAVMAVRHRRGRLILRRAADRERQQATNEASLRWSPVVLVAFAAVLAVGGLAQDLALAALGGVTCALAPVLLWIAFALRPDQRVGEDL